MGKKVKKGSDPMDTNLILRMKKEEKQELQERLALSGMDMSNYIRSLIELDKKEGYICRY